MDDKLRRSIRENYDRLAAEYAQRLFHELERKQLDRELLDRFAALTAGRREVCDMGCGPGHVARYLRGRGAAVFGLDLSPRMIGQARTLNPELQFHVVDMTALELADNQLAGIAGFYAIVNIPRESLPVAFGQIRRVLQPGGILLLAFHIGDEIVRPEELWGQPVAMNWLYLRTSEITRLLEAAGFAIDEVVEREPYDPDVEHQSRRAYIFARKLPTTALER